MAIIPFLEALQLLEAAALEIKVKLEVLAAALDTTDL
jgi:hypothetical protein